MPSPIVLVTPATNVSSVSGSMIEWSTYVRGGTTPSGAYGYGERHSRGNMTWSLTHSAS